MRSGAVERPGLAVATGVARARARSRAQWPGALLLVLATGATAQRPTLTVTGYRVRLDLPASGDTIAATARVAFARAPAADTLVLNLVGLTIESVAWAPDAPGDAAEAWRPVRFRYDGQVLRIPLPAGRGGPEKDLVEVRYHGVPRDGLLIGVNARGRPSVFADNWPERVRFWLPSVDRPAAKAAVAFEVHAPPGWRVVANGSRVRAGAAAGAETWVERRPVPPYTMVVGAGRFTVSEHRPIVHGRDTVPIEVWAYPEDSAYADSGPFRRATEIVATLERLVGPFPYEKLAHVESATRFGGMENASAIFYDERAWSEGRLPEEIVRHETAHQWFGDAVTEREWHHLWLSEGFATYFAGVVGAALDGDSLLNAGLRLDAARYFQSQVVDRPIVDTAEHDLLRLLNANNYEKGSWVLAMLRAVIGDSAFWTGIRAYYRTFRDSTAVSDDLQGVMERAAGEPLGWFFDQWLRQPGYPMLACRWGIESGPGPRVRVTLREVQPAGWGAFRLPGLTLEFRGPDGERVRRITTALGRETVLDFPLPFVPVELEVDPDHALLLTAQVTGS